MKILNLAIWNVPALLDNNKLNRPERRTVLVARELARYNVDIAAITETRFADKGQLTDLNSGYIFWSGRNSIQRREAGVRFAMKSHLVQKLVKLPQDTNYCVMILQLPIGNKRCATLISVYAPTMTKPDDIKDKFYEELETLISAVPQSEKLFVLNDFNIRVGQTTRPGRNHWQARNPQQ